MLNCIVLAGGKGKGMENFEEQNKALINIYDKPMITYVIDVLEQMEEIDSIVIVGDKDRMNHLIKGKVKGIIEATGEIVDNAIAGERFFGDDKDILLVTSDIPLITKEAIKDFIEKSNALQVELCYPIVRKEDNESKYPGVKRTYVKLREGIFTGGNIFYVKASTIREKAERFKKFIEKRKNPIEMVSLMGIPFVFKLLTGTLTIDQLEKRVKEITDVTGKAIISRYAEIGTDVDKASDLELAHREILKTRN